MTVTADHIAALRAALAGDAGAFGRIDRESGLGDGQEFPVLVAMAFIAAVRRRPPASGSPVRQRFQPATGTAQDFIRPNGPGSRPAQPFPHPQGNVAPPAPQISGPSPRREDETTYARYALRRRRAPDQCDSAVSRISVLDAAGSSAASASI